MPYKRKKNAYQKPSTPRDSSGGGRAALLVLSNMASQTEDADPAIQGQDHFDALMQAISTCQSTLTEKIDTMQLEMGFIRKDMDKVRTRLTEAERRVGDAEEILGDHASSLRTLTTKVRALEHRAEDAEEPQ